MKNKTFVTYAEKNFVQMKMIKIKNIKNAEKNDLS